MFVWSSFLDLLRASLFTLAHVCGGSLGGGILVLSLMVRVALLPLTLRLAIRARELEQAKRRLHPKLETLQKRYASRPLDLMIATRELYAANGIDTVPKGTFLGTALQLPIATGIYQTIGSAAKGIVRFLWVKDLSRPDALVASVAAGLAGAAVMAGPASPTSRTAAGLAAAVTFLFAWRLSAGVGLYWIASNVVTVVQSLLVRRASSKQAG
jgi:YidC/Oxa1 family membrane protein insertase